MINIANDIKDLKNNKDQDQRSTEEPQTFNEALDLTFPLNNLEELNNFEDFLNTNKNSTLAVSAKNVVRCGGNTSYDFIKRAMTPLISNSLAAECNWEGKKRKCKFSKLNMVKMIVEANKIAKILSTQEECEKCIVGLLKRAKERKERIAKKLLKISLKIYILFLTLYSIKT